MSQILVIEDDSTTRLFLKRTLKLEGYDVEVAKDGEEGLGKVQQLHPGLIICDWMMPRLDGIEVCRQVKENPQLETTAFILLSSRESVDHCIEGLDAGADEFISKPIDPKELLARVRAGLRQHKLMEELKRANKQVHSALQDLQHTQAQLIHSEKMSGLGKMVAGVAHEINNPINFIHGNLVHSRSNVADLLELLHLYQRHYPHPNPVIQEKEEEIDLDFIAQDLPNLLASAQNGVDRVRQIVLSLRKFSRLDEAELKEVNLHENIDSTLMMLQYRLDSSDKQPGIQVIKNYSNLPLIECYSRQLNQVFFNILSNAIDFLNSESLQRQKAETKQDYSVPTLEVSTEYKPPDQIQVRIADNGVGITEEARSHIFDPFFTTKPIGRGTGMGLSISYQIIVAQHGGSLECVSSPGQGTEFIIQIPQQQTARSCELCLEL